MIVLDTHAWIWWVSAPKMLSARARAAIDQSDVVLVPAICCWEVATAVARGRIELDRETLHWIKQALARDTVRLAEMTPVIAVAAADLGRKFHGDPGDRLIVATALVQGCPVVTKDTQIRRLQAVRAIW